MLQNCKNLFDSVQEMSRPKFKYSFTLTMISSGDTSNHSQGCRKVVKSGGGGEQYGLHFISTLFTTPQGAGVWGYVPQKYFGIFVL